jgi:competence protein ComGC
MFTLVTMVIIVTLVSVVTCGIVSHPDISDITSAIRKGSGQIVANGQQQLRSA